jgi:outer membrane biosynthesis protein TonB
MNQPDLPEAPMSQAEMHSALFANLVVQNTQMAFLFLGKMPHPETGEFMKDLEAAQSYIAFLEMLEAKTKGNLDRREEALLKQSLTNVRMVFVKEMEGGGIEIPESIMDPSIGGAPIIEPPPAPAAPPEPQLPATAPVSEKRPEPPAPAPAEVSPEPESRKKFTKKY